MQKRESVSVGSLKRKQSARCHLYKNLNDLVENLIIFFDWYVELILKMYYVNMLTVNHDGLVRSQAASFIKIWLPKLSRPK
jgi:hypothetical protein